jgi:hypothetical protein
MPAIVFRMLVAVILVASCGFTLRLAWEDLANPSAPALAQEAGPVPLGVPDQGRDRVMIEGKDGPAPKRNTGDRRRRAKNLWGAITDAEPPQLPN